MKVKEFFGIAENHYEFEICDVTTIITILNVALILSGVWWGPILGLANCAIFIGFAIIKKAHINNYLSQAALVVLNVYFLLA